MKHKWKPLLLIFAIIAMMLLAKQFNLGQKLGELQVWMQSLGTLAPLVFMGIYILATILALPGSALTVMAGAIFGTLWGVIYISIASTIGACLCFLIARYLARNSITTWLGNNPTFQKLDALTEKQGAIMVAITRLVPVFPFNLLNYGFGLTRVSFGTYAFWSWICMFPGTILYVAGTDAVVQAFQTGEIPWRLVGLVVVLIVGLSWISRIASHKLKATGDEELVKK